MRRTLVIALLAAASLSACGQKQPEVIIDPAPPSNAGPAEPGEGGPQLAQGGRGSATNSPVAAPPTAAEVKAAASDPNRPHRKAGLWQLAASNGEDNSSATLCVTDVSEARVDAFDTRRLFAGGGRGPGGGGGGQRQGGEGGARPGGGGGFAGPPGGGGGGGGQRGGAPCPLKVSKDGAGWKASSTCKREFGENSMTIATSGTLTGDLASKYSVRLRRSVTGAPREEMNRTTTTTVNATYKGACPAGQKGGDLTVGGDTINLLAGGGGRPG
jgi:hypothetical protein